MGKFIEKVELGSLGNLSENAVHIRVSKGSWIYEIGTVGVTNT